MRWLFAITQEAVFASPDCTLGHVAEIIEHGYFRSRFSMAIELETVLENVSDTPRERTALLRFSGILSLRDVAELKSSLKRLLREGITNLLLDLEELKDMDEAVCEVLVSTVRKLRKANGRAIIRGCTDTFYNHLMARKWDRDFLFPSRRADHLEALPKDLRVLIGLARQPLGMAMA